MGGPFSYCPNQPEVIIEFCVPGKSPFVPLFQRGISPARRFPLFEKEGPGEIYARAATSTSFRPRSLRGKRNGSAPSLRAENRDTSRRPRWTYTFSWRNARDEQSLRAGGDPRHG